MSHPSTERLHAFLRDLSLQDAALLAHLLRCSKCAMQVAVGLGMAPSEVRDLKAEDPPPNAGENYPGLFDRLERTVGGARKTFTRDRIAAELLLGELLLPTSKAARIERLYAEPRFHQLALAELLLARSPYDPAERRDLVQLASAILDLVPEERGVRGRRASLRAAAYISLGEALREMGDFAGAEAALLFAPEWVEHTGDVLDAADFCRTLGRLRQDQKRRDEAIALLGRAADLYEEISQSEAEARIRVELGELCLQGAEPGRALEAFLSALRLGPVELAPGLAVRSASGAAECWLLLEGPEAALGSVAGIRETFGWQADSGPDLALRGVEARLLFETGEIAGTTLAFNESLDGLLAIGAVREAAVVAIFAARIFVSGKTPRRERLGVARRLRRILSAQGVEPRLRREVEPLAAKLERRDLQVHLPDSAEKPGPRPRRFLVRAKPGRVRRKRPGEEES